VTDTFRAELKRRKVLLLHYAERHSGSPSHVNADRDLLSIAEDLTSKVYLVKSGTDDLKFEFKEIYR
jgi:hypothetical protein